mmetsp:Transcript_16575/g.19910  ORF Transcript_16575/g.19910 Transcript_16575/m.19910 type:complete len:154 (-) Transcript_16575:117-578(-)|eukprot:CAMPEP_0195259844 /NCGR_PEP_ID=MMETSP0706-20130129/8215_1 /TAXON_ID=33640 /ORGANISM="Asterionellopsis glacialis, Strain CCMP134" /LENGTH=153 /DNA_ID=CAMNT_0040313439 /DNA_START=56 /DNA_END=517 /DNA_ORIENTATION=+
MQENNGTTITGVGTSSHPSTTSTTMDPLPALDVIPTVPTRSFFDLLNCCAPKKSQGESTDGPPAETAPKNQVEPRKEVEVRVEEEEEEQTLDDTLSEKDDKPIDFDLPELEEVEREPKPVEEQNTLIVSFLKIIYTVFFFNFFGNKKEKAIQN